MLCAMKETNDLAVREESDLQINKGVELMLRNKNKKEGSKTFQIKFGKMISLFRRELHVCLDFSLDVKNKE